MDNNTIQKGIECGEAKRTFRQTEVAIKEMIKSGAQSELRLECGLLPTRLRRSGARAKIMWR